MNRYRNLYKRILYLESLLFECVRNKRDAIFKFLSIEIGSAAIIDEFNTNGKYGLKSGSPLSSFTSETRINPFSAISLLFPPFYYKSMIRSNYG